MDEWFTWDAANNLTRVKDSRIASQMPAGCGIADAHVTHDALYRVTNISTRYNTGNGWTWDDPYSDPRQQRERINQDGRSHREADPMNERPAPLLPRTPDYRNRDLTYSFDFLGNMTEWTDDAAVFYERSIGDSIENGVDAGPNLRPSALYLASNIRESGSAVDQGAVDQASVDQSIDRGGYLTVDYGEGGNVLAMEL